MMINKLKQILMDGVEKALADQAESANRSFIMQGKGEAFKEVLHVIDALEQKEQEDGSKDSKTAKEKTKK